MPRLPRSYIKTPFLHVMTQGINKSYIFEKEEDIRQYIKIMKNLSKEQEIEIIAYCIMNNHAHILIKTEDLKELSKYMQRLNTIYGKYYNQKYNRVGYVFRDRYQSEGIYSEEHLYNCIKYIYENPVKAGICNKAEEYLYSNYKKIDKELKEGYVFIDVKEDNQRICEEIIEEFLIENKMKLNEVKKDKEKLRELVIILKREYNISLRKIAKEIKLNRETVRKLYNN